MTVAALAVFKVKLIVSILILASATSYIVYVLFFLPEHRNEQKFYV